MPLAGTPTQNGEERGMRKRIEEEEWRRGEGKNERTRGREKERKRGEENRREDLIPHTEFYVTVYDQGIVNVEKECFAFVFRESLEHNLMTREGRGEKTGTER